MGYRHLIDLGRQEDEADLISRKRIARAAKRRGGLARADINEMSQEDLAAVAAGMDEREMIEAELVVEQMQAEAAGLERELDADGVSAFLIRDAGRAARIRERAAWIQALITETRLTGEPVPGLGRVRHLMRDQLARVANEDPAAQTAAAASPKTSERDQIAAETIEALLADLRDWGAPAGEIEDLDDHLYRAEEEIRSAAAMGRDEAMREMRERSGVLKRRISRFIRSDI